MNTKKLNEIEIKISANEEVIRNTSLNQKYLAFKEKYKNVHLDVIHDADHEFYDYFDELKVKVGESLNE